MIDQLGSCSMQTVPWFPFKTRTGPADIIFRLEDVISTCKEAVE